MDIFEEIVKLRREGKRAALATIIHTNGSIPSYQSSRMLVREDGSIAGTVGGGCVEAEVWAAAKEVLRTEAPRNMVFHLNNKANYDNGLICGGTLEIFVEPILPPANGVRTPRKQGESALPDILVGSSPEKGAGKVEERGNLAALADWLGK